MFPAVSVASSPPLSHLLIVNISVVKLQDIYCNTAIHSEDYFVKTLLCGIYCAKKRMFLFLGGGLLVGTVATVLFFKRKYTPF